MVQYPDTFLRGMLSDDPQWFKDGMVQPAVFKDGFDDPGRSGRNEMSINWHDGDEAVTELMNRPHKSEHRPNFLGGVAVADRGEIDRIKIHKNFTGCCISYERSPILGNEYHGNILFSGNKSDTRISMFCAILASTAGRIKREEWMQQ
jgi:hypothetical protein